MVDREMVDREMVDREMVDREMVDREMVDREMVDRPCLITKTIGHATRVREFDRSDRRGRAEWRVVPNAGVVRPTHPGVGSKSGESSPPANRHHRQPSRPATLGPGK
jgi:hypothetical protein